MWVEIAVPERQLGQVSSGNAVDVTVQGVKPALREGQVADILPLVDQSSRTVPVRVTLSNDEGDLRPGMSSGTHSWRSHTESIGRTNRSLIAYRKAQPGDA